MTVQSLPNEEWRDVKGFWGYYQVSNFGRVKSLARIVTRNDGRIRNVKEKLLKPSLDKQGRPKVVFRVDCIGTNKNIHRLVAETFIGIPDGHEVGHRDGDWTNDKVNNLFCFTPHQRIKQAHFVGCKAIAAYKGNKKVKEFFSYDLAATWLRNQGITNNINNKSISQYIRWVINGKKDTVYGFVWKRIKADACFSHSA